MIERGSCGQGHETSNYRTSAAAARSRITSVRPDVERTRDAGVARRGGSTKARRAASALSAPTTRKTTSPRRAEHRHGHRRRGRPRARAARARRRPAPPLVERRFVGGRETRYARPARSPPARGRGRPRRAPRRTLRPRSREGARCRPDGASGAVRARSTRDSRTRRTLARSSSAGTQRSSPSQASTPPQSAPAAPPARRRDRASSRPKARCDLRAAAAAARSSAARRAASSPSSAITSSTPTGRA